MRKKLCGLLFVGLFAALLTGAWPSACAAATDYLQLGFQLMKGETLGPLGLGTADTEIARLLGETEEKSPPAVWGADGLEHQQWRYPDRGVALGLVRKEDGLKVDRIKITAPCEFRTKRGIGVGSQANDVRAAYGDEIDPRTAGAERLVAGSVYGGIVFTLQDGVVASIFIGAGAE